MTEQIILQGVVGSTAYGLAREGSDVDRLGVFVSPTDVLLSLHPPSQTIVTNKPDSTFHEVGKFIRLALKCNPSILELLWLASGVEVCTREGEELQAIRGCFLSEPYVRNAYGGYALQQHQRMSRKYEELLRVYGHEAVQRVHEELASSGWTRARVSHLLGDSTEGRPSSRSGEISRAGSPISSPESPGSTTPSPEEDVWTDPRGLRGNGGPRSLDVSDLLYGTGRGGGSLSRDREGEGPDLSEVQSGDGPLSRFTGPAGGGSELHQKWWRLKKNARHCFRLLRQGRELLETGEMSVRVSDPEFYWQFDDASVEEITALFEAEDALFRAAKTKLPQEPETTVAEEWLLGVRKAHW